VIYDTSFAKLREVRLGYTFPDRIWGKTPIRDLSISVVGRNLALWTNVPHIDPETSSTSQGARLFLVWNRWRCLRRAALA